MTGAQSVGDAEARDAEIYRLLRPGDLSGREIARRVGCSHGHVDKLRNRGLPEDEPAPRATTTWRPHRGPFSRLEAAERERDELFAEVQDLAATVRRLHSELETR
jgi:hypothetical protein